MSSLDGAETRIGHYSYGPDIHFSAAASVAILIAKLVSPIVGCCHVSWHPQFPQYAIP